MISARFRRWVYLLFTGMWVGERAVTGYDKDNTTLFVASTVAGDSKKLRFWWKNTNEK